MITKRQFGMVAAVGSLTAAIALLTGLPSARAGDLQANPVLQQRVDQLAQGPATGGFPAFGAAAMPAGSAVGAGSFPRSFLIPGTDTSIRVGGQVQADIITYFSGMAATTGQAGESIGAFNNPSSTGNLTGIPLNNSGQRARSGGVAISSRESKINVETRTPTPWGEARTFIEFDFNQGNSQFGGPQNPNQVSSSFEPRLRYAYATLGNFLAGQANSNFKDSDSEPETLTFGGVTGSGGPSRHPELRYTWPVPWTIGGSLSAGVEQPTTDAFTPYGYVEGDTQLAGISGCAATTTTTTTLTGAGAATAASASATASPAGTSFACLPLSQLNNPTYQKAPDFTLAYQLPQPWGHFNLHSVVRELSLNDGKFINKDYLGFGAGFGVDVKPGWFGWAKDDITAQFNWGQGAGMYIQDTAAGLATNYGILPTNAGGNNAVNVRAKLSTSFGGHLGYQHWWADNLRSTADFSFVHTDIDSTLIGTAAGGSPATAGCVITTAATVGAPGAQTCGQRGAANKELTLGLVNLIYSPVAFVDMGVEYVWGHRLTVGNLKGDSNSVEGVFRVKF